jgi:hypothetical protein
MQGTTARDIAAGETCGVLVLRVHGLSARKVA